MPHSHSLATLVLLLGAATALAQENAPASLDEQLKTLRIDGLIHSAIGVTRQGTPIPCVLHKDDLDLNTKKTRVLLVAGLDASPAEVKTCLDTLKWFYTSDDARPLRQWITLSAVPCADPDAHAPSDEEGAAGPPDLTSGYPPKGAHYVDKERPQAQYLWRWIGMHAPDTVIALTAKGATAPADDSYLWRQLNRAAPSGVGSVPAGTTRVTPGPDAVRSFADLIRISAAKFGGKPSPARLELQRRVARSPIEVAQQLAKRYGHDLRGVSYIPALALVGRVRLGELTDDPSHLTDVRRIIKPYMSGEKATFKGKPNGSNMSGHLVFALLAERDRDHYDRYVALTKAICGLALDDDGKPVDAVSNHSQMSDSVFMVCPMLARAGVLTGDARCWTACLNHLRYMRKLCARDDGLYRHSPQDEAAWGRGNGFPALGLALALTDLPADFPGRGDMFKAYQQHMAALAKHQDYTGAWHQVIDRPESYREFSATCMATFAMVRGLRRGWLPVDEYEPVVNRAWHAIKTRIAPDATLVDMCTGTGKQKSLRAYYDRSAILGPDARGGAMALMVATEIALWEREQ